MQVFIYSIKNELNGKIYIGSSKNIDKRRYEHFWLLERNEHHSYHLQQSYNKYGRENFTFSIVEECSINERKERELYHIVQNKSHLRTHGYNVHEPNENKFQCSEETKNKMKTSSSCHPIDVYQTDGTFIRTYHSLMSCSNDLNISQGTISNILNPNSSRKSAKGYVFVRHSQPFNYIKSSKVRDMTEFYK